MKNLSQIVKNILIEQYYDSLGEVNNYVDSNELIGEKLWFHTNRTHKNQNKNGMIGIYGVNSNGNRKGSPLYYTNEVFLQGDIHFQSSSSGAERIVNSGKRTLVAGVSGIVKNTNMYKGGGIEVTWSPQVGYFHLISDSSKEVVGANAVYFHASEAGKWTLKAINPVFS